MCETATGMASALTWLPERGGLSRTAYRRLDAIHRLEDLSIGSRYSLGVMTKAALSVWMIVALAASENRTAYRALREGFTGNEPFLVPTSSPMLLRAGLG